MKIKIAVWNIRNWIQLGLFVFTIGIGFQFYLFVKQSSGDGEITIARPAGVEGFLPIGALMAWKRFLLTGEWDTIHPAAMVILGFAVSISFLFKKSFCSWFCPVGTLSEWLWKTGERVIGKNFTIYKWIELPLRSVKYFLLFFFVYIIARMNSADIYAFLQSPYYKIADVKMLNFFIRMSPATVWVITGLIVGSIVIRNFWCRYLCPYGALMGIVSLFSLSRIIRNPKTCIQCSRCVEVCPSYLPVNLKNRIDTPECSGCMDCTNVCPVDKTLYFQNIFPKKIVWKTSVVGVSAILILAGSIYLAQITGRWQTHVSKQEFKKMRLMMIDSPELTHPTFPAQKQQRSD